MRNRFVVGFLATGLLSFIFFGWLTSGHDHASVESRPGGHANLQIANQTSVGPSQPTLLPARLDAPSTGRALPDGAVSLAASANAAPALKAPAGGSDTDETFSKQDLHGAKAAAGSLVAVDRLPDRGSPEFASAMAVKNSEMNALHARQAAEMQSSPGLPLYTPQAPQTRKGST